MAVEPQDWSPRWNLWPREVLDMIARTLFVTAWADEEERAGRGYPGQDLMDVAPETPPEAAQAAMELMKAFELLNKDGFPELLAKTLRAGKLEDSLKNREEFGYLLAMQALGHGVGLGDEFGDHGLEVPDIEFYL